MCSKAVGIAQGGNGVIAGGADASTVVTAHSVYGDASAKVRGAV
jgi:hypothetical protein